MPRHPLAEVFGFPVDNFSVEAYRFRDNRLCPFNNRVRNCTKDKINDPLGVCSIFDSDDIPTITCPVRFRQNWLIAEDAASFFFPQDTVWTSLAEIRINDVSGKSAGNIDMVLVAYDKSGAVTDFGALEVQGVYISGNIRSPFEHYMIEPEKRFDMDWSHRKNYPRADYLSSSRKRLAPQLVYKGSILNTWGKKMAVAVHTSFYNTLPSLPEISAEEADIAWLLYDLQHDKTTNRYHLVRNRTVYTSFQSALERITTADLGPMTAFMGKLQEKLNDKLGNGDSPGGTHSF